MQWQGIRRGFAVVAAKSSFDDKRHCVHDLRQAKTIMRSYRTHNSPWAVAGVCFPSEKGICCNEKGSWRCCLTLGRAFGRKKHFLYPLMGDFAAFYGQKGRLSPYNDTV